MSRTAAFSVPELVTDASAPDVTSPIWIVAAAPSAPFAPAGPCSPCAPGAPSCPAGP